MRQFILSCSRERVTEEVHKILASGSALAILCSDHGTAYGEDGFRGHRLAHPTVWTVPYAEFVLPAGS